MIDGNYDSDLFANESPVDAEPVGLSVVIPVFNEQENLPQLIVRSLRTCISIKRSFEIILVDDGSSDSSARIIKEAAISHKGAIVGVFLNRNYGQHAAVMAGFAESRGSVVVTLDADLQNPPEEIPKLIEAIDAGYDVVGSVRIPRYDTLFRRMASFVVNKVAQKATGVNMHDYGCMLRAYRRHIVNAMLQCPERSTFIPALANGFARSTTEVEVRHADRAGGDSKYGLWKLVNLQFDLLTSMTTFPLRLMSVLGAVVSFVGVGFGAFLLVMRMIYGPGWAAQGVFTLFAFLFILIGAQFIAMGVLGEYIGRIYYDVRGRPRYFVQHVAGKNSRRRGIEDKEIPEVMI
ncbi:MAG: undecaprenyl-phosphate 4-deoxy-4-formamido-L-arabinose transferase [Planctomycetota bacterium]|nr:MAG: undecaprenyl-phosphate 4-deoxy-4-formamido-L-arabinose transferase [Planctomycetota bacterium]